VAWWWPWHAPNVGPTSGISEASCSEGFYPNFRSPLRIRASIGALLEAFFVAKLLKMGPGSQWNTGDALTVAMAELEGGP
jgi:hypothetical protein